MQTEMREVVQSWGFYMGKCPVLEEIPVISRVRRQTWWISTGLRKAKMLEEIHTY